MNTQASEIFLIEKEKADLAMTVTPVSFAMLFASLFLMYAVYRSANATWPPMGFERISLFLPILSLFVIGLSSYTFYTAQKFYDLENLRRFQWFYFATIFLALVFVLSQFFIWKQLRLQGIYLESGIFASILYGFTWIHCAHVLLGLFALLYCLPMVRAKNLATNRSIRLSNVAKFWHFLGVIWFLMIVFIFVL